ncbi:MAG: hypothetical protein DMF39_03720 [Verrucomicrobia bacterium]|nr:MAG: hypothetical protein DMF39_03720 [Verrucomicrobiota bacterium]
MNAAHLRSDRAADHILFDVWTIDGRFASQDDSLSWPELLTRYDIKRVAGQYILMEKSVTPRQYKLTPISETVARFDEGIEIPSMSGGPIWVRIDIRRSFWGKSVAMLFHSQRESVWRSPVTCDGPHRFFALACDRESPVLFRLGIDELAA